MNDISQENSGAATRADEDAAFMAEAIALGRAALGSTAPNPAVGAIVVKSGRIVGRGATRAGGRPHAETEALADAGDLARGATLYVSLEPCSHHGRTPPCADAIIRAGVARVVSALDDPDPRVAGRGHARIAAAGIAVTTGVLEEAARRANLGHVLRVTAGRPMVTLKLAETADGYAAGDEHDPRLMITGRAANAEVQRLRASHDAIMIGSGTQRHDDPLLTVRGIDCPNCKPLRVVLDTRLRLSPRSRIAVTAAEYPTLVIAGPDAPAYAVAALAACKVEVARVSTGPDGHIDLRAALHLLAERGITRVLSEGGPRVGSRLILEGLADEVIFYRSPRPLGRPGIPALSEEARALLTDHARFHLAVTADVEGDRMQRFERFL